MSSLPPQPPSGAAGRGVWIAVFVLGAVIVALLAAVLFKLNQQAPGAAPAASAALAQVAPAQPASASAQSAAGNGPTPSPTTAAAPALVAPPPAQPAVRPAAEPRERRTAEVRPAPAAVPEQFAPQQFAPQTAPGAAPQAPVCSNCGTVISVQAHEVQSQKTNPLGVIAGGVVGGLLGNQIGGGNGRTAATVVGAIGGGIAGNEIAKRVDTQTIYRVQVRMDDGQVRTLDLKVAPPVGQRVQIGADGGLNPI